MKGGTILLIVGLFLGYLAVSGKYKCITHLVTCVVTGPESCSCGATTASVQDSSTIPAPPKTFEAPPYEGPGPVSYLPNISLDAFV